MSEKRFQEYTRLEKAWRYRWYLLIPFQWVYYMTIGKFKVIDDKSHEEFTLEARHLKKVLVGLAQSRMKWYWTQDEVFGKTKKGNPMGSL